MEQNAAVGVADELILLCPYMTSRWRITNWLSNYLRERREEAERLESLDRRFAGTDPPNKWRV